MTPRFAAALEKFQRLAESLTQQDPQLHRLVKRAFSPDLDRASDAVRRIERDHDAALAAIAWAYFWIRQAETGLATRELESIRNSQKADTLWGGIALTLLGELYVELGETRLGEQLIRSAEEILGTRI